MDEIVNVLKHTNALLLGIFSALLIIEFILIVKDFGGKK